MSEAERLADWLGPRAESIEQVKAATELRRLSAELSGLQANEKVLLAQIQGHTQWREKIIKASEQAYGESAVRYKFSLTKNGKCMNTFPTVIDGRWFALVPAEDDGHIGHVARIAELEQELEKVRKDAQNRMYLLQRVRDFPENVTHKGSLLWTDILRELSRAAMKGTP